MNYVQLVTPVVSSLWCMAVIQLQHEAFEKGGFVLLDVFLEKVEVGQLDTCSFSCTTCSPVTFLDFNHFCCCDLLRLVQVKYN